MEQPVERANVAQIAKALAVSIATTCLIASVASVLVDGLDFWLAELWLGAMAFMFLATYGVVAFGVGLAVCVMLRGRVRLRLLWAMPSGIMMATVPLYVVVLLTSGSGGPLTGARLQVAVFGLLACAGAFGGLMFWWLRMRQRGKAQRENTTAA